MPLKIPSELGLWKNTKADRFRYILASFYEGQGKDEWTISEIKIGHEEFLQETPPSDRMVRSYIQFFLENGEIERIDRGTYRTLWPAEMQRVFRRHFRESAED